CSNTAGNYSCSCTKGHSSKDPKSEPCVRDQGIPVPDQGIPVPAQGIPVPAQGILTSTKIVIGSCVGLVLFITCIFCIIFAFQ
ncbi:unnamed protein product, partial [Musa banksii]